MISKLPDLGLLPFVAAVVRIGENFLLAFGGGIVCGLVVGAALIALAARTDNRVVEITFIAVK